jgi:predicted nucleotidyltransferase
MDRPIELLSVKRAEIESLCKVYAVKRLQLFGSAATGNWDPTTSDFDFIVEFDHAPNAMHLFDQYLQFKEGLEAILERTIDLVELSAVRNGYFLRNLERTARDWYAA